MAHPLNLIDRLVRLERIVAKGFAMGPAGEMYEQTPEEALEAWEEELGGLRAELGLPTAKRRVWTVNVPGAPEEAGPAE